MRLTDVLWTRKREPGHRCKAAHPSANIIEQVAPGRGLEILERAGVGAGSSAAVARRVAIGRDAAVKAESVVAKDAPSGRSWPASGADDATVDSTP